MHVGFPKTLSNSCAWNSLLGHCRSTLSYDRISHLSRRSGRGRTSAKNGIVTFWAEKFYVVCWLVFEPRATGFSLVAGFSNLLGSLILGGKRVVPILYLHRYICLATEENHGKSVRLVWKVPDTVFCADFTAVLRAGTNGLRITLAFVLGLRQLLSPGDTTAFQVAEIRNSSHRIT